MHACQHASVQCAACACQSASLLLSHPRHAPTLSLAGASTSVHARAHTEHTRMQTCTPTCTHTPARARARTHAHTHAHTHTHTHTHNRRWPQTQVVSAVRWARCLDGPTQQRLSLRVVDHRRPLRRGSTPAAACCSTPHHTHRATPHCATAHPAPHFARCIACYAECCCLGQPSCCWLRCAAPPLRTAAPLPPAALALAEWLRPKPDGPAAAPSLGTIRLHH